MSAIRTITTEELKQLAGKGFSLAFQILQHREDAADAVQDSLHQLYRKQGQFDSKRGTVQAWFLKMVRNRCIDIQRKSKVATNADDAPVVDESMDSPGQSAQQNELIQMAKSALDSLPRDAREIIMLRDFHDLSYAEISEILGIPSGTVMSRLHRAREQLRKQVIGKDGKHD